MEPLCEHHRNSTGDLSSNLALFTVLLSSNLVLFTVLLSSNLALLTVLLLLPGRVKRRGWITIKHLEIMVIALRASLYSKLK